jgi:hypothetical protein
LNNNAVVLLVLVILILLLGGGGWCATRPAYTGPRYGPWGGSFIYLIGAILVVVVILRLLGVV